MPEDSPAGVFDSQTRPNSHGGLRLYGVYLSWLMSKLRPTPFLVAHGAVLAAVLSMAPMLPAAETGPATGPVTLKEHIKPVLEKYCFDCHNDKKQKGDVNLLSVAGNPKLEENRKIWEKVAEVVEGGDMPPEKKPQPSDAQRDLMVKFIDGQLAKADCNGPINPGKVTIRRLNREEYKNTIRDLMGVNFEPEDFPNDEVGYGFDNIGDVLALPPMLMEKYIAAADEVVHKAIVLDTDAKPEVKRIRGDEFQTVNKESVRPLENKVLGLYREGEGTCKYSAPRAGEYVFRVRAYGELAGPEPPKLALRVDGKDVTVFNVGNEGKGKMYETRATLPVGARGRSRWRISTTTRT